MDQLIGNQWSSLSIVRVDPLALNISPKLFKSFKFQVESPYANTLAHTLDYCGSYYVGI
jgi:hypothetical protein